MKLPGLFIEGRERKRVTVSVLQEEEEYETKGGRRRTWDDDFVLKRQFSALVPAFDPRPGRTNVQQTTDLEIPPPGQSLLQSFSHYVSQYFSKSITTSVL